MKTNEQRKESAFKNRRQAFLAMMELNQDSNVFEDASRLMYSLKFNFISSESYSGLCQELEQYCKDEGIETSIAGISLKKG